MTSDSNTQAIKDYFRANTLFCYPPEDAFFFEQSLESSLDFSGCLILETETSLVMAPHGNGEIHDALKPFGQYLQARSAALTHIQSRQHLDEISRDPAFIGLCIHRGSQICNKVFWRADKAEKVGVLWSTKGT